MSNLAIIALAVLVYIVQVLLMLSFPYYKYRENYKSHKDRTIGGFVKFTNCLLGDGFMILVLSPFIGLVALIITLIIGLTVEGFKAVYNKYIKDIKI